MRLMNELKKETDKIVLVDTNVLINIENRKCSKIDLDAINKIYGTDIRPFLTDLSYCELVIGCRNFFDFKFHCEEINEMEFMLCGFYKPMCDFLSSFDYKSINNDLSFFSFKKRVIELRDETIFPLFNMLFNLYIKFCIIIFHEIDRSYWDCAFFTFNDIFKNKTKEFYNLIYECFKEFISNKDESKKLVNDLFSSFLISILCTYNPEKYIEEEITKKISQALSSDNFSKLVKILHIKKNSKDVNWKIRGFIEKTRDLIDFNEFDPTIVDGICFILSQILFNKANFNFHDLIDLYIINFSLNQPVDVYYYTNDFKGKWKTFVDLESILHPNVKILFNK